MRKLIVLSFMTIDGIIQSPGAPEEDTSDNFKFGGWLPNYFDEFMGSTMSEQMKEFDLLLGRKTYDLFASYWPSTTEEGSEPINNAIKYVVTKSPNDKHYTWKVTKFISGDIIKEINKLKKLDGPELQVHGSANLIQTLLQHDVIDEFWLKIFPVVIGSGKRLFTSSIVPSAFTLDSYKISPKGVIIANYKRTGELQVGSI